MSSSETDHARAGSIHLDLAPRSAVWRHKAGRRQNWRLHALSRRLCNPSVVVRMCDTLRTASAPTDLPTPCLPPEVLTTTQTRCRGRRNSSRALCSDLSDALSGPDGHDDAPAAYGIRRRVKRRRRRNPVGRWRLDALAPSSQAYIRHVGKRRHGQTASPHSDGSQQPRFGSAHGLHRCSCLHHGELRRSALGLRRGRHR